MALKRLDIQVLRGYAVLMVLLYHAGLGWVPSGYIGVDVFFVISGFLITGNIDRQIATRNFSLAKFYLRRVQRLLPAAYVTFWVTSVAAVWLLTSSELRDYAKQLIGAVTFTANFALKNQAGYFDGAADLKPLLHTWTLSIEEQFYLIFPLVLLGLKRQRHQACLLILTLTSLGAHFWIELRPESMFYMLPYRAWELLLGALASRSMSHHLPIISRRIRLDWLGWLMLCVIPLITHSRIDDIWILLAGCLSAAVILITHRDETSAPMPIKAIRWTGDISYSLYLVHWPLFAFYNNVTMIPTQWDSMIRCLIILMSFLLASGLHYGIERPILGRLISRRSLVMGSMLSACVLLVTARWVLLPLSAITGYLDLRQEDQGLGISCASQESYDPSLCISGLNPKLLVWGDSMAMQLVQGLMGSPLGTLPIQQATRSTCAPLLSLTYKNTPGGEENCVQFNEDVLAALEKSPSIEVVVLSARWNHYLRPNVSLVLFSGNQTQEVRADGAPEALTHALGGTVRAIRSMGKRVIIVDAPPSADFDVSRCLERTTRALPTVGAMDACGIRNDAYRQLRLANNAILDQAAMALNVPVIRFDSYLCATDVCSTTRDGVILYRDNIHFSRQGALKIMKEMDLFGWIQRSAN